ncbi:MAG: NAD(P)-dependent oxidoreductase [Desulfocapsa sp.]|nr:NAD(P)-dependent oxidoreductase [Desulfocapsa sp.]
MNIFITGGTGFIGKKLATKHAKLGHQVTILTRQPIPPAKRPSIRYVQGNLTDKTFNLLRLLQNTDVLYHCAAEITNTSLMHRLHVQGTKRLLEAVKGNSLHWVQLSSCGIYGNSQLVISEETEEAPVEIYEQTKLESDRLVQNASINNKITSTILRPTIVFGEDMPNNSIRQLISVIRSGFFFFPGTPETALANYIYVDNVIDALYCCATNHKAKNQVFIINDSLSMLQFVGTICQTLNSPLPRRVPVSLINSFLFLFSLFPIKLPLTPKRILALTDKRSFSNQKITNLLGFSNKVELREGIQRMVQRFLQTLDKQKST